MNLCEKKKFKTARFFTFRLILQTILIDLTDCGFEEKRKGEKFLTPLLLVPESVIEFGVQ